MRAIFDRQRLVSHLGNEEVVSEILMMFTESITQHLNELTQALNRADLVAAQRAVHNIKGISGTIYCHELHHHATTVDRELKDAEINPESISQMRVAAAVLLAQIMEESVCD